MDAHRLPQITAALVIVATGLEVSRDRLGMFQCRSRSVGPLRRKLGAPAEDPAPFATEAEKARDEARQVLAGICRVCPFEHCNMKTWGMN